MNNETNEKKDTNMKTNCISLMTVAIAALALTTAANAQYKPVSHDGIAASPKVRQMLNERKAAATPAVAVVPAMACPKCADVTTTETNPQAKGGEILAGTATKAVTRHACTTCETRMVVVGEGKGRHTIASHKCAADVPNPATCCASN
jgi:hypothetical protein